MHDLRLILVTGVARSRFFPFETSQKIRRLDSFAELMRRIRRLEAVRVRIELRSPTVVGGDHGESETVAGHQVSCSGRERSEQVEAEEYRPDLQEFKELVDLALRLVANEISGAGQLDSQRRIAKIKGKEIPLPLLYTLGLYHGLKQAD